MKKFDQLTSAEVRAEVINAGIAVRQCGRAWEWSCAASGGLAADEDAAYEAAYKWLSSETGP